MISYRRGNQEISRSSSRSGFSLIEVILATAILMGSVVVLARLVGMGRDQASKAAIQTKSQQLCENTMNELLLGLRPLEPVDSEPLLPAELEFSTEMDNFAVEEESFGRAAGIGETGSLPRARNNLYGVSSQEGESEWLYSIRLEQLDLTESSLQDSEAFSQTSMQKLTVEVSQADETLTRPVRFSLTRWVRTQEISPQNEFGGDL